MLRIFGARRNPPHEPSEQDVGSLAPRQRKGSIFASSSLKVLLRAASGKIPTCRRFASGGRHKVDGTIPGEATDGNWNTAEPEGLHSSPSLRNRGRGLEYDSHPHYAPTCLDHATMVETKALAGSWSGTRSKMGSSKLQLVPVCPEVIKSVKHKSHASPKWMVYNPLYVSQHDIDQRRHLRMMGNAGGAFKCLSYDVDV